MGQGESSNNNNNNNSINNDTNYYIPPQPGSANYTITVYLFLRVVNFVPTGFHFMTDPTPTVSRRNESYTEIGSATTRSFVESCRKLKLKYPDLISNEMLALNSK